MRLFLTLAAGLVLCACAGRPPALPEHCIWLAAGSSWCLRGPAELPDLTLVQQVEARHSDRTERFIGQLEIKGSTLTLAALSPLGQRLFLLRDDGRRLRYEAYAPLAGRFEPGYVLADLQLAFWPLERLEPSLAAAGLKLEERDGVRTLSRDGELVARARITPGAAWPSRVVLEQPGRGYTLTITTLELARP